MTFIDTVPTGEASGAVAELYEADRADDGYVWNNTQAFSHRPEVYSGWNQFLRKIVGNMEPRRYELATLAAARRLRSSYCMLAHGSLMLRENLIEPDELRAVATDHRSAGLAPAGKFDGFQAVEQFFRRQVRREDDHEVDEVVAGEADRRVRVRARRPEARKFVADQGERAREARSRPDIAAGRDIRVSHEDAQSSAPRSTITPTPRALRCVINSSAISSVILSCTCGRLATASTTRASLERPMIRPFGK